MKDTKIYLPVDSAIMRYRQLSASRAPYFTFLSLPHIGKENETPLDYSCKQSYSKCARSRWLRTLCPRWRCSKRWLAACIERIPRYLARDRCIRIWSETSVKSKLYFDLNGADSKVQEWGQSGTSAACATLALGTRTMGRVSYISLISIPLWRISSSVGLLSIVLLW